MTHNFHPTSLREYDIRGIIGETLGADDAYAIGRGFGTCLVRAGGKKAAVGYDGRVSSPLLASLTTAIFLRQAVQLSRSLISQPLQNFCSSLVLLTRF